MQGDRAMAPLKSLTMFVLKALRISGSGAAVPLDLSPALARDVGVWLR
jgi:hypothetical protein